MTSSKEKQLDGKLKKLQQVKETEYLLEPLKNTLIEDWTCEFKLFGIPKQFHEKIISEKKEDVMNSFIAKFQTWDEINSKKKNINSF
jgi:hypothetical protein